MEARTDAARAATCALIAFTTALAVGVGITRWTVLTPRLCCTLLADAGLKAEDCLSC
jgi:hypothetical protein